MKRRSPVLWFVRLQRLLVVFVLLFAISGVKDSFAHEVMGKVCCSESTTRGGEAMATATSHMNCAASDCMTVANPCDLAPGCSFVALAAADFGFEPRRTAANLFFRQADVLIASDLRIRKRPPRYV